MAAQLNVQFTDPPAVGDPSQGAVRFAVETAFNEWTRHFDYTAGTYTINVTYKYVVAAQDAALSGDTYAKVGNSGAVSVVETAFGLGFAARNGTAPTAPALTLFVNPTNFGRVGSASNIVAPLERELEHGLGVRSFRGVALTQPIPAMSRTFYDGGIQGNDQFFRIPPTQPLTFFGPNAYAAYGGPVPLGNTDASFTNVGGEAAVNTYVQGASTVQPLDVALLRDAGLPALTDQELLEHSIARLYFAAFGRSADSAGLILQLVAVRAQPQFPGTGSSYDLATVGASLASSAEFTARYGALSDADFIRTVYQNALGRQPDAATLNFYLTSLTVPLRTPGTRGDILNSIANSDEARGRLSANPNVTYAAAAEEQVARLYDAAFGRDADPTGFNTFVPEIAGGTTLQQAALSFLGSAEFASRYGAAPSNQAFVDALYQNALHRTPDAAGEALYVQALASGQLSQAGLLAAFSDSQEHINLLAQRTDARDAAGYNLDLSPHLGIIPTISGPVA